MNNVLYANNINSIQIKALTKYTNKLIERLIIILIINIRQKGVRYTIHGVVSLIYESVTILRYETPFAYIKIISQLTDWYQWINVSTITLFPATDFPRWIRKRTENNKKKADGGKKWECLIVSFTSILFGRTFDAKGGIYETLTSPCCLISLFPIWIANFAVVATRNRLRIRGSAVGFRATRKTHFVQTWVLKFQFWT